MARLRKTLSNAQAPYAVSIRQLLETQSKAAAARCCLDYARSELLPVYLNYYPEDQRGQAALNAAELMLTGQIKLPAVKKLILEAHAAAREAEDNPPAQAAIRAVAHAASVVHSARHAMGIVYYGSCALVYERLGLDKTDEEYDAAAALECSRMEQALQALISGTQK